MPPDAHVQAHLPIPEQIQSLSGGGDTQPNTPPTRISPTNKTKLHNEDDPLGPQLGPILKKLLEEEHQRALDDTEESQRPLLLKIETREAQLDDNSALDDLFADYLRGLPDDQRPKSSIDQSRLHIECMIISQKRLLSGKDNLPS